jgi:hypothetical protein
LLVVVVLKVALEAAVVLEDIETHITMKHLVEVVHQRVA